MMDLSDEHLLDAMSIGRVLLRCLVRKYFSNELTDAGIHEFSGVVVFSDDVEAKLKATKLNEQAERDRIVAEHMSAQRLTLEPKLRDLQRRGVIRSWEYVDTVAQLNVDVPAGKAKLALRELEAWPELEGVVDWTELAEGLTSVWGLD